MPGRNKMPLVQQLASAEQAIQNSAQNSVVAGNLAEYGYAPARIAEGQALCDSARAARFAHEQAHAAQIQAADDCKTCWAHAAALYMRQLKIARVALQGVPGAARTLAFDGRRKQGMAGWLADARQFYSGLAAQPELAARLGEYGISEAKLAPARAALDALEAADQAHEQARGAAQAALAARRAAFAALHAWMSDFMKIARIALEEQPQLLEALGVRVRS
jgi:hypothetical protein